MITLRDYQLEAVQSVFDYYAAGNRGNPLIGLPTGTGKSLVIAELIRRVVTSWISERVMALTHVKKLIEQNSAKLLELWPNAPVGIHSAGMGARDVHNAVIFGGVQSVRSSMKRGISFGRISVLFIDEAHLLSPDDESSYQFVISELRKLNPDLIVIGLTATPYRLGQGMLTDDGIFTDFCYNRTSRDQFNWFLEQGYLAHLIPKATETTIDVEGVKVSGGRFDAKQLEAASNVERVTAGAIREMLEHGSERERWLVFTTGIDHCLSVTQMLEAVGVACACVHSKRDGEENDKAIRDFQKGRLRALVNVDMLTTGFDCPEIDLIAVLRPTLSPVLWVQMLGRGTRPAAGKRNCLVLDYARNTPRLGPINDPIIPRKPGDKKGQPAPVKICPECGVFNHTISRFCIACAHEFDFTIPFQATAGTAVLIAGLEPDRFETHYVTQAFYARQESTTGKWLLKVIYVCGVLRFTEVVPIESGAYRAREWWGRRSLGRVPYPKSIEEALTMAIQLPHPKRITVRVNSKFPEITNQEF